jgi:TIR domain
MSEQPVFDVFLCHNSEDKSEVEKIAHQLRAIGLEPWLDKWELPPGRPWRRLLEEQIGQVRSAAVFVGSNGRGPWQELEIDALLNEFARRQCPVIPVLLHNASAQPDLPLFLKSMEWVDFRRRDPNPMYELFWGVTGIKLDKYLNNKLEDLKQRKIDLEKEIKVIEKRLDSISQSEQQLEPNLAAILNWLGLREDIAEECGNLALERFQTLKKEVAKQNNLSDFHLEISTCLEFIALSLRKDNLIFVDEPALPATLANIANYKSACSDVYTETFRLVKNQIPDRFDSVLKEKLEARIDYAVSRLLKTIQPAG